MIPPLNRRDLDHILEHATPQFVELSEGRLFLTGATGLFGSWLLESLAHAQVELGLKFDVQFLSRDPDRFLAQYPFLKTIHRLSGLRGDIRTFSAPDGSAFTHMIHGAATSAHETFAGEPAMRKYETVTIGTRNALQIACATGVEKFLYLSSGAVYAPQEQDITSKINESCWCPPAPYSSRSTWGIAKVAAEHLCFLTASQNADKLIKVARCFSFIGPRLPLDIHYAVGNFVADALAGRDIVVRGTGSEVRSYLYLADLVVWILAILVSKERINVYNVGSSTEITIKTLAQKIANAVSPKLNLCILGKSSPSTSASSFYVPDTSLAFNTLGLRSMIDIDQAIDRTIRYHQRALRL